MRGTAKGLVVKEVRLNGSSIGSSMSIRPKAKVFQVKSEQNQSFVVVFCCSCR